MMRSELIPQTKEDLGSGHLFYHFSLSTNETNAPSPKFEHQIAFFEVGNNRRRLKGRTLISSIEPFHRTQIRFTQRRLGRKGQHPSLVREQRNTLVN
jgi:hypothetical protein